MAIKIIDLSCPVKNENVDLASEGTVITYRPHEERRRYFAKQLGVPAGELPWSPAVEMVTLPSHAGTHVDAPWHFGRTQAGKPAYTVDQIPLDWFYGDGVMLDFSNKGKWDPITAADIRQELDRIGYTLKPGDIVLIRTGLDKYYYADDPKFIEVGTGMIRESVEWLLDQGIKVIATDSFTLDMPIPYMLEKFNQGDKSAFFPTHKIGIEREYTHIEKVFNMDKLPRPFGFKFACFPVKLQGASGAWARAVAIFED